jgi:hypothetical protein
MTRVSRVAISLVLLALPACSSPGERPYPNNDLALVTAYTAKEVCSCRFVMGRTEAECRAWTRASPAVATFRIDEEAKVVSAAALGLWGARARWISEQEGCRLDP